MNDKGNLGNSKYVLDIQCEFVKDTFLALCILYMKRKNLFDKQLSEAVRRFSCLFEKIKADCNHKNTVGDAWP